MTYQTGLRDSKTRWLAIHEYLDGWRLFTALDFGAYGLWFSSRLVDHHHAVLTVVDDEPNLQREYDESGELKNWVDIIPERLTPAELRKFNFDVALCLSVLHHLPDWRSYLDALLDVADVVFIELPDAREDLPEAKAHHETCAMHAALERMGAKIIAHTPGYDTRYLRPIYVIDQR